MPIALSSGSFYGAPMRRRELAGFILTESAYDAGARVPAHLHEQPYLCLVLQGGYEETTGGRAFDCEPGDVIFHPAGEGHADRFGGSGGRCFNLEVGRLLAERLGHEPSALRAWKKFPGGPMTWLCRRLHDEFCRQDVAAPLAMEGLALELLAEIMRRGASPERRAPRWLGRVRELLHAHFADSWTLTEIAESVDVDPAYLARSFRRHLHLTVGEYVRGLRIEYACQQLAQSDAPLKAIAAEAGFADQSHFTRSFKRVTGLTPARYRSPRTGQSRSNN